MIGVISANPVPVLPFIEQLAIQAETGIQSPHGDGFGIGCFRHGGVHLSRSTNPVFKEKVSFDPQKQGEILLLHARKSGKGKVKLDNVHPYSDKLEDKHYLFAHNGTVDDIDQLGKHVEALKSDEISDTSIYFEMVMEKIMEGITPDEAIRSAIKDIKATCKQISALNCLMTDGKALYAARHHSGNDAYYALYKIEVDSTVIISTEPFNIPSLNVYTDSSKEYRWQLLEKNQVYCFR